MSVGRESVDLCSRQGSDSILTGKYKGESARKKATREKEEGFHCNQC